jgi:hypothetical protein
MSATPDEASTRVGAAGSIPAPQTQIDIAVDTAYIALRGGEAMGAGIYMMDNRLSLGSSNEGTQELHTRCNQGDLIGFEAYPIDVNAGYTVAISGFNISQGSVFGAQGDPLQQTPGYWVGQAMNQGAQTYQIGIQVISEGPQPTTYNVNWGSYITAQ